MNSNVEFKQFTMFDLSVLHPDIWYWENALSFPEYLVDFIEQIDLDQDSYSRISKWDNWHASDDDKTVYGATKTINTPMLKKTTGSEITDKKTLYLGNSFLMAFEMCYDKYIDGHKLDKNKYKLDTSLIPLKKWNQGQQMGPHFDGQDGHSNLAFSLVAYINDDYLGGEIHFKNQNVTLKPKAGSLIMFPSQEPFIHEVKPIISGTRYMSPAHSYIN